MRAGLINHTLYTALALAGFIELAQAQADEKLSPIDYQGEALFSDIPLPDPNINQRPVVGSKSVLLSVINWKDENKLDKAVFERIVFSGENSLSNFIAAASKNKLTLHGQTIAHTSLEPRPELCKSGIYYPFDIATSEGKKAALAHGIEQSDFDYIINVIDCRGGGQAYMPGSLLNIYGEPYLGVFAHEFGHSLGYNHSETYTGCPKSDNTIMAPAGCTKKFQGDSGDATGGGSALFPMHHRLYSGWLESSQAQTVSETGIYSISRAGRSESGIPELLLINRGAPLGQIALELREPDQMFENFPPSDNRTKGLWIRFTQMGGIVNNIQLDATPETASTNDPTLEVGKTLRDEEGKISVTVCDVTSELATAAISLNDEPIPSCS